MVVHVDKDEKSDINEYCSFYFLSTLINNNVINVYE